MSKNIWMGLHNISHDFINLHKTSWYFYGTLSAARLKDFHRLPKTSKYLSKFSYCTTCTDTYICCCTWPWESSIIHSIPWANTCTVVTLAHRFEFPVLKSQGVTTSTSAHIIPIYSYLCSSRITDACSVQCAWAPIHSIHPYPFLPWCKEYISHSLDAWKRIRRSRNINCVRGYGPHRDHLQRWPLKRRSWGRRVNCCTWTCGPLVLQRPHLSARQTFLDLPILFYRLMYT